MTAYLMEIENLPPVEYERFALRRLFWQDLGLHFDEVSHQEAQEAVTFLALERQHPHRFKTKAVTDG